MKPDQAREHLGTLRSAKHQQARLDRVAELPKPLAAVGLGIFGLLPTMKPPKEWPARRKLEAHSAAKLDADPKGRAKVLAALFPTLHVALEAGWKLRGTLPYTAGHNRRGFRAPHRRAMYAGCRQAYLENVYDEVAQFPDDTLSAGWLAAWAVHLGYRTDDFGYLLAGVIDAGGKDGEEVFGILKDCAANRHEIGGPGGHATRGLLCCSRPDAWEFMEKLLLAAQRQEGLRQTILEAVDEAHPQAFRRMLGVVLDDNLIRFASVARAAGVWFGHEEEVENPKQLKADIEAARELLGDSAAQKKAVAKGDAEAAYRALWAMATEDAEAALTAAAPLFKDKQAARRYAAAKLADETGLPEAMPLMVPLLDDADERLVAISLHYLQRHAGKDDDEDEGTFKTPKDLFERVEKLIPKLPAKEKELKPLVDGWDVPSLGQEDAAELLITLLDKRKPERLLPYLKMMGDYRRVEALGLLCVPRTLTGEVRETLLAFAGEPNRYVREAALTHLKKLKLAEDEVQSLEGYLTRKTADFRRSVFELLLTRGDKLMTGTIDRLLSAGDANSRGAGIELARRMVDGDRAAAPIRARLVEYKEAKGKRLPTAEADAIEIVLNPAARPPTLDDGLGTFNPAHRSAAVPPKKKAVTFTTPAAAALLTALDEFIHARRDTTFTINPDTPHARESVLGSIEYSWHFPSPNVKKTAAEDRASLPLLDVWEQWYSDRPKALRDADGLELIRAAALPTVRVRDGEQDIDDDDDDDDRKGKKPSAARKAFDAAVAAVRPPESVKLRYEGLIGCLLQWFQKLHPPAGAPDFLLDCAETALAAVPEPLIDLLPQRTDGPEDDDDDDKEDADLAEWRENSAFAGWLGRAAGVAGSGEWTPAHSARLWQLSRWRDEPAPGVNRLRPDLNVLLAAYDAGAANETDFYDHLIGPRPASRYSWGRSFDSLGTLTGSKPTLTPELTTALGTVVARVIDCELVRGETPTPATKAANEVAQVHGLATLVRLLAALGKNGFNQGARYGNSENKPAVLTQLIKRAIPGPADTPAAFAGAMSKAVADGLFPVERIAEFGLVNPRWVAHVAAATDWEGFEEAVYWFIAHTGSGWGNQLGTDGAEANDDDDQPQTAKKEKENPWQQIVRARTNLTAEQLADGLIDVQWFHAAYAAVGDDARWDAIEGAAKFLGYGQAHKKATRLADVLLGRTKRKELVAGIRGKFLKENVRLLGLLPLPTDPAKLETELSDRYKVLKEYERYARGLSSLSKEPALQAARLGMENLAVTAGYGDPVRLEWAVTAKDVADVVAGKATAKAGPVTASLTLTEQGEPELGYEKDGKPLTKVPPDVRKNPKVAELVERKKQLTRTVSSTKRALEQAMCAGSQFAGNELKTLMGHPLVRPLLERLVLFTPSGMGYPNAAGTALKGPTGKAIPVKAADPWAVAHPLDLLASGDWPAWQSDCFKVERIQPFKQLFREVYVPTAAELEDALFSRRYSGQQVNETQGKALFATRGWSTRDGIVKLFRDANLMVLVSFDHGYSTPADAAAPAVGQVEFRHRGDWKAVPLATVPKAVFSEVMRDLDLVVSVAHVGGVDPEATQSTVAMRAALLTTTFGYLKVKNVTLDGKHALIAGEYGKYSVHLGSGVVHKQPGGSLCVVPVNAQHRGRLFLPFADDDPRTAEVVSKVLLLARDKEIQDPTILQQIVGK